MFDDFDTQIQCDEFNDYWYEEWPEAPEEIDPDEYDDWLTYVYSKN